jgi:hypothetical protein
MGTVSALLETAFARKSARRVWDDNLHPVRQKMLKVCVSA